MNDAPPPVSPYLTVHDARAATEFYQRAFGAVVMRRQEAPNGKLIHVALSINGGLLMLCDEFPEMPNSPRSAKALGGSPVTIHLDLADVDAVFARALEAGATATMPLADMFWGDRYGKLTDPFGHSWSLATRKTQPSEDDMRKAVAQTFPAQS